MIGPVLRNLERTWTLETGTGTGLVSRIDGIGLFVDPELELMFPSLIDVIGLVVDPGTSSAWLEREPRLLGWNRNGTGESIDAIGLFVDPELELMFPSLIDVIGLVVDPGTSSAWLEREPRLLGWNRNGTGESIDVIGLFVDPELELMFPSLIDVIGLVVDPGTSSAWLEREPRLLGWNLTAWAGTQQLGLEQERNW